MAEPRNINVMQDLPDPEREAGVRLAARAVECWQRGATFREERLRNKRFTYGDQWGDKVEEGGITLSEEEMIRAQGNMPLKNNLIRRLVRNVLGVFRNRWGLPRCVARDPAEKDEASTLQKLLHFNMELNRSEELYARTMEEFLISGVAIHKKWFGRKMNRTDCWTDIVSPDNFFIDSGARDFRNWDINFLGEIHEMEMEEAMVAFGPESGAGASWSAETRIRVIEVWSRYRQTDYICHDPLTGRGFRVSGEDFAGRVMEENRRREAEGLAGIRSRRRVCDRWRYHFLTSDGLILASGDSPYSHGSHPYVFKGYPFIDGEIHSFVGDVIDQQKLTNRLISMYDWILRASAKGVLLFPEGALPAGGTMEEIIDEWSRFNGVIVYRPKPGIPLPQQVSSKGTDIGITELLDIQMKMMEDISGVNGALQGKLANNSMSGTLYDQQTRNSLTALADILRSFDDFMRECTFKDLSNLRQYYSPRRIAKICGDSGGFGHSGTVTEDFRVILPEETSLSVSGNGNPKSVSSL